MQQFERIALLNFGGIGDEILFSPVIHAVRQKCPDAHITLILEARSCRVKELLPDINSTVELDTDRLSKAAQFWKLLQTLRGRRFDLVISSGSSAFIALLLGASGIPVRIGYDTGLLSRLLLSATAPLNKQIYAAKMYYALAETFLALMGESPSDKPIVIPRLHTPETFKENALTLLSGLEPASAKRRILIHPGVSHKSVEKNILKAWPVRAWKTMLSELLHRHSDLFLYLVGGPDDAAVIQELETLRSMLSDDERARMINLYGKTTSLMALTGLIAIADLMVCVDSAPMHLAIGLETPTVAIFGPTDPQKLLPNSPNIKPVFRQELTCRPCLWDHRQNSCAEPVCLEVSPEAVIAQIEELIGLAS
jgi:ADP-heptose:LPS heptosyltransferase